MADIKKLIDLTLLTEYHGLLKTYIDNVFKGLSDKVGDVPDTIGSGENVQNVANFVDYVTKKIALANADATALTKRVKANEDAIGTENTSATATSNATGLYLYIDEAAAAAVAKVVADADTDYDTLKEIEQWILNGTTGALKMQNDIKALQGVDGAAQTKDTASIPGVKAYIDDIVKNKNVNAGVADGELLFSATPSNNAVTVASTQKLRDAVARAEQAVLGYENDKEDYSDDLFFITGNVADEYGAPSLGKYVFLSAFDFNLVDKIGSQKATNDASGIYADIQGNTTTTIAALDSKVGAIVPVGTETPSTVIGYIDQKSAADVADLKDGATHATVAALEEDVDAWQLAESSQIAALFAA